MKVSQLKIESFRGIKKCHLTLPTHVALIGDNNTGKSTLLEALNLALGPNRLNRWPVINEHDFYKGDYLSDEGENPEIKIEVTITNITDEQRRRFVDYIEWWNQVDNSFHVESPPESIDKDQITEAIRITFIGLYDPEIDDFTAQTYFTRSLAESDRPQHFTRKDKQICGFLYLRSLRTGSRALSLEQGSLLDIILNIKGIRPQMWENALEEVSSYNVASKPEVGISGILESIENTVKKYVPREWGATPHLKVSKLTREHLRNTITAFIATGEGEHAAPFYMQGTGTINVLVLAMLSMIAKDKRNVIFAMEEPETALPPYAQKRIIHEIRNLASQSLFTSHSPYVLEEFGLSETMVLSRDENGRLNQSFIDLPDSVKHKRYRQEFRTRFCEGLLSRRLLIAEGATEATALPAVARRLSEINSEDYSSLEALGICVVDAGSETQIADLANLYGGLGKEVYAVCDKQGQERKNEIEAVVDQLFMHQEDGFEGLVLNNTTSEAIERFIDLLDWPPHLLQDFPNPKEDPHNSLFEYFKWAKGNWGIADFLSQCNENEIPIWIKETCAELKEICGYNQQEESTDTGNDSDLTHEEE
ncbi:MAG TPA: AAA family ATPase [Balneolaceae bacterium]